ncbi:hypothetical protein [Burkholderia cepacia]|uniref:hypothetical protein n=1 Tax=Burkholderia cepacia TaxID=292 RepID=UPI0029903953|nr:hypothetical protein [Burkholderia cepacia]MDW9246250.1 hypothetical protein [Burkholderia cepacia]
MPVVDPAQPGFANGGGNLLLVLQAEQPGNDGNAHDVSPSREWKPRDIDPDCRWHSASGPIQDNDNALRTKLAQYANAVSPNQSIFV